MCVCVYSVFVCMLICLLVCECVCVWLLFCFWWGGGGGTKCSESQADIRKLAYTNYCHCHGTEHHARLYPNAKVTETGTLENLFIVQHYQGPYQRRSKN